MQCCLANFPSPAPEGCVTVCELNSNLVFADSSDVTSLHMLQDIEYPSIDVAKDGLRGSGSGQSAKSAFLEFKETLWRKTLNAWRENGTVGILQLFANNYEKDHNWLCFVSKFMLAIARWSTSLHGSLYPHLTLSDEQMLTEFTSTVNWHSSLITICMASTY